MTTPLPASWKPTPPSVTTILKAVGLTPDFSMIPADVLSRAQARGTDVHAAIEGHHYGYTTDLNPEYKPWYDAYLRFVEETEHVPIVSENEVVNEAWGYCGHPDRIGWLTLADFAGHRTVIDFKSGAAGGVEYQLAGYAAAWNAQHPKEPIDRAVAVALKKNGTYRLLPERRGVNGTTQIGVDLKAATAVWQAAVVVFKARGGK